MSRLRTGQRFAESMMRKDLSNNLSLIVAVIAQLPLANNSVDVVFASHTLETNHGREELLFEELLRIARQHLLLFEPSWKNANQAVKDRMTQHDYIRHLPKHIENVGGCIVSIKPLPNPLNPMNPTYCYDVKSMENIEQTFFDNRIFQYPRFGHLLYKQQSYGWSHEGGWAYPDTDGIACFREKNVFLMSHG